MIIVIVSVAVVHVEAVTSLDTTRSAEAFIADLATDAFCAGGDPPESFRTQKHGRGVPERNLAHVLRGGPPTTNHNPVIFQNSKLEIYLDVRELAEKIEYRDFCPVSSHLATCARLATKLFLCIEDEPAADIGGQVTAIKRDGLRLISPSCRSYHAKRKPGQFLALGRPRMS